MDSHLPANRARLALVLRATRDVVSITSAASALEVDRKVAAKLLSRWVSQGWMRRIGHGMYVPVPLDLAASAQVVSDPWVMVPSLFGECYIGGWTAAHHWDFTEQLFNETLELDQADAYPWLELRHDVDVALRTHLVADCRPEQ